MARITLSIADDIAAQLDTLAAESNLNRSQTAEYIFREFFRRAEEGESSSERPAAKDDQVSSNGDAGELAKQLQEVKDYLALFHAAHQKLSNFVVARIEDEPHDALTGYLDHPQDLPAPPWRKSR